MSEKDNTSAAGGGEELTLEERKRRFRERCKEPIPDAPPTSRAVVVAVDALTAENARARPDSIRIATRDESGATRLSAPRRYSVDAGGSSAVGWISWAPSGAFSSAGLWFTPEDKGDDKVSREYDPVKRYEEEWKR